MIKSARRMFSRTLWAIALLVPLALSGLSAAAANETIGEIGIFGNERIETATIITYLGIKKGDEISRYDIDTGLKELYKTGFFSDVRIELKDNNLVINVVENPSISQVAFEGNSEIDDEDLEKEISLRSRSIYTRNAVQRDVKRLLDIYRRNGRYSASIDPKVIQRDNNRIDLVYEITEGPETSIRHISFIGNRSFSSSTLQDVISSAEHRWYKFLTSSDKYDPDRLEYDKELLRRFYRSEGYADFNVKTAFAELTPDKDAFYLTFTLSEGPKYDFGDIEIDTDIPEEKQPELITHLSTKAGEGFNSTEIEGSIDKMVELLGDKGFAFVDVDPILKRRNEENIIDLTYHVKEGPRVYVERINIFGNLSTLDEVIRREMRLVEGDAYSTTKLRRSEQRLKNLGYFESVNVNTEQGSTPDKMVINVEVAEQSTGEISLGAGFSSVDGALADIGLTERNFLGRGQTLRFHILAAAERQQFDVGFTEPYLFGRDLSGGFDLYKITQDFRQESSFDRDAIGGRMRAGYSLGEKLRHNFYYAFEENEVSNIDADASRFIKDQEGTNITSIIGHSFIYDDRNNRFDPTTGWFAQLNQDFAGLGGDDRFVRHELLSEYYIPLAPKWTIALAGSAGHLLGISKDIRINQRFFVGGKDLRGFDTGGIGPRDITTDDALGGNIYYTASTEIRFPLGLPEELGFMGAIFADAGSLWEVDDSGPEVVDSESTRASVGFGISWASPFGPIRIDFAKALVKEDYDDTESIRFSFGTRF